VRITHELGLVRREVLENKSGQIPVLSEVQEVLEVERVDPVLGIIVNDLVGNEQRFVRVGCAEAVHGETAGQTSNGPEQTLKRLGEVV
jgi:hypothetical protein